MKKKTLSKAKTTALIALVFLLVGYETALFIHKAATLSIVARSDRPDTVYVIDEAVAARLLEAGTPAAGEAPGGGKAGGRGEPGGVVARREASHSPAAESIRSTAPGRHMESFPFNPNTVSEKDLVRLGFTPAQARSIISYREKGGRFRRKSDFAKSYVVSDSIFKRLEPYITIPKLDINSADSAAFDALPGIGGYFAAKLVSHRKELHGYSSTEQMMDIYHFDREKYEGLKDLVYVDTTGIEPYPLWTLPADSLRLHPYIHNWSTAKAIVLYRENNPRKLWTVEGLAAAGVLTDEEAAKLALCRLK